MKPLFFFLTTQPILYLPGLCFVYVNCFVIYASTDTSAPCRVSCVRVICTTFYILNITSVHVSVSCPVFVSVSMLHSLLCDFTRIMSLECCYDGNDSLNL